jgi:hypothetical protein
VMSQAVVRQSLLDQECVNRGFVTDDLQLICS